MNQHFEIRKEKADQGEWYTPPLLFSIGRWLSGGDGTAIELFVDEVKDWNAGNPEING